MEAQNRLLPQWFERIRTGQLRLPRFQRFEAWGPREISDLVETVLRGLPAGATLILQVGDEEKFISRPMVGAPDPSQSVNEHLLDGQQRLTALWRSLNDLYETRTYFVYEEADEEHEDQVVPRIHAQARWKRNGGFYPLWADQPAEIHARELIPLRLLRPGDMTREISRWCSEAAQSDHEATVDLMENILRLRDSVTSYNIPYLQLPVTTAPDVALDVFIKTNTTSVKLTAFDIVVAQVEAATGESLHQLVSVLMGRVPRLASYVEPENFILTTAALREDRPPTQKSFQLLDHQRLVDEWETLIEGAKFLVNSLEAEKIFDGQRLPTVAVLPVVGALWETVPGSPDARGNARALIRKYLWRSFLTDRYERAAATRALQDLRGLIGVLENTKDEAEVPVFQDELHTLPVHEELIRVGWPKTRDVLARGLLAISMKGGALDFAEAEAASADNIDRREYHHLFPHALLTREEYGGLSSSHSFRALNCALITWNTNRTIASKEPIAYLRERTEASTLGEEEIRQRLRSHLVPHSELAVGGYEELVGEKRTDRIQSDYRRFLNARAELMSQAIESLAQGHYWP